jgi:uncharacterized protein (DUF885 family)
MRPHARRLAVVLPLSLALSLALFPAAAGAETAASEALHELFDREWEWRLRESPMLATSVGRHEWNDRLSSVSAEDEARRAEETRAFLAELDAIDREALGVTDQINHDIFRSQLANRVESFEFGDHEIPINADSGWHSSFARLPQNVPLATPQDYENYIARLNAFPTYAAQHIANMRSGLARGMTLAHVVLEGIEDTIAAHIVEEPEESAFWEPFESFPVGVPESEWGRLRAAGETAIRESIVAAYQSFFDFMVEEYKPGARRTLGASELPEGRDYYQLQIRIYTSLDLTPEEIHQIGLSEVKRIRQEMEAIIERVGFEGEFADFLTFLRTDPRFYAETPEELLMRAAWIAKRMDGKLPALFKTMPRLPYTVEAVPDAIAPKYTGGRYVGAAEGSTQPGRYWVNTYALENRPFYTQEALTLHEAVPGHHFQVALSRELEDLPNFRRYSYISAFGEGWGLYSEFLGIEAGFYTDPYSDFGRLTYEMWRACRLVVDTGVHAFGWSREQALDFLAGNTALSLHEVRTEIDRYISWPAQALSYKLGELKIKELRRRAEAALGAEFDIREFHDAVLLHGAVPLPVLERQIERFIAEAEG